MIREIYSSEPSPSIPFGALRFAIAARSREVSSLDAHKREETSRSMRRSRIVRDKTTHPTTFLQIK